jgi:redox-sensitive bicupin YhaK (pirin superfamily)
VGLEVRRSADRFTTARDGSVTRYCFSFGAHYDPANVGFGSLVALNDEQLPPDTGYPDHPHRDTEIVTVVLSGALRHTDSAGRTQVLAPGQLSRTSAGAGIVHAEVAEVAESDATTRFVQTWLRPDEPGGASSYVSEWVGRPDALTEVVGPNGVTGIGTTGARLHLGNLPPGRFELPDAPLLHVFVADGAVDLADRGLLAGDAARLTDEGGRSLTVEHPAQLLVWSLRRVG